MVHQMQIWVNAKEEITPLLGILHLLLLVTHRYLQLLKWFKEITPSLKFQTWDHIRKRSIIKNLDWF
jgi:hypothetical protein